MATKIEWTDETWNPVTGCTKVSPGCDHCYAESIAHRFAGTAAYPNGFKVTLRPERLGQPLRWRRPRRIFVNSMADLFHDDVPDEYIARVFAVMATAHTQTFQVLTKRHARMRALLNSAAFVDLFDREYCSIPDWARRWPDPEFSLGNDHLAHGPLRNVWLGVSVENQQWAAIREPALRDTPAAVRFLSCEPLLGPVDCHFQPGGIDWVIAGGESGSGARPMHPDWARSLRDQCIAAGVPFLFKQWGEWMPAGHAVFAGVSPWTEWRRDDVRPAEHWFPTPAPDDPRLTHTVLRRVGKKAAGRELDGRTWDQYPDAVTG